MEFISQTIMYFHKGGLVMYPLLFCSFAVFAIAIERFLFYRAADSGEKFADDYCALLKVMICRLPLIWHKQLPVKLLPLFLALYKMHIHRMI